MFGRGPSKAARTDARRLGIESLESRIVMTASPMGVEPVEAVQVSAPMATPAPVAALLSVEEWVQSLSYWQFSQIEAAHVPYLTSAQLEAIPNKGYFGYLSESARGALSVSQVRSLKIENVGIALLTTSQIGSLTANQIQQVGVVDFPLLSVSQIPLLTATQLASVSHHSELAALSPAARGALTATQIRSLNIDAVGLTYLTSTQIGSLSAAQVQQVTPAEFRLLPPSLVPYLSAAQLASMPSSFFAAMSPAARAALTTAQIRSLDISVVGLSQLTAGQISLINAAQVQQVQFWEFGRLPASHVPYLSLEQIASIATSGAFRAMTPEARGALTASQVRALNIEGVGLSGLTAVQVGQLSSAQVQQVQYWEFGRLPASLVPYLSLEQVASIPTSGALKAMPLEARVALTPSQVRALNIDAIGLSALTAAQVGQLSLAQVLQVKPWELWYLTPSQIPNVSVAQLGAISAPSYFTAMSIESRAALSTAQIQSLNVNVIGLHNLTASQRAALSTAQLRSLDILTVGISLLTPGQIGLLTAAQLQNVSYWEFKFLGAGQIPYLTLSQLATIPTARYFSEMSAAARAALTATQLQSLNVGVIGLGSLSASQIGRLTSSQISQVSPSELSLLAPSQIPMVTPAQIAAIWSTSVLSSWSSQSLAALTPALVRAINVAGGVSISALPASQIAYLSTAQVQAVPYYNFVNLLPFQIPLLTAAQMASIPNVGTLLHLSEDSQAALSRQQIMSLSFDVLARYTPNEPDLISPVNYVPVVDRRDMGGHGHSAESMKFYNLAPLSAATHVAVASGDWSDPRVWSNGRIPAAGARVVVSAGVVVEFDSFMTAAIDTLRIDGTLSFAVDRNTQLKADTIVVYDTGKLHIGTEANPIRNGVTASILIADGGPIDRAWDPYGLSRGVVSGGEVRMFGADVTPYVALAVDPMAGDTTLRLSSVPVNWKVGDKLVISGSDQYAAAFRSEEVTILAINGTTVTVDRLTYNHDAPDGYGFSIYVANKSRNILFQAEDASVVNERPHMVFFGNPNVEIENISITGFGRTDKSININDPIVINGVLQPGTGTNPRAKYALHFHHTGVDPLVAPAKVSGSIVVDSPGWGFVNHQSNVIFDSNVALDVKGSAFVTEDGNEIGAFTRNLAMNTLGAASGSINARRSLHDFGFNGHGFWMQGPGVEVIGNIASGTRAAAFVYFTASARAQFDAVNLDDPGLAGGRKSVPVGAVPFKTFQDNVSGASGGGLEIWFHQLNMTDAKSVVTRFKSWNTIFNAVAMRYVGQVQFDDAVLVGNLNSYRGTAISPNNFVENITINNLVAVGFEYGIDVPGRRSTVINGAFISAINAIHIRKGYEASRTVAITGQISILPPPQDQLSGRTARTVVMAEPAKFLSGMGSNLAAYTTADRVIWAPNGAAPLQLFYKEQVADYIPFPSATATGYVPAEYLNRINSQLWYFYGTAFGGGVLPSNAFTVPGIDGYAAPWQP